MTHFKETAKHILSTASFIIFLSVMVAVTVGGLKLIF